MRRAGRDDTEFVYGTGIHAIDCVQMLGELCLGGMRSARVLRAPSLSGRWNFHLEIAFGSGAWGRCDLQPNCGVNEETYAVYGRNTCVIFRMPWFGIGSRAELWEDGKLVDSAQWAESDFVDFGFYQEHEAFMTALENGRKPWPSVEATLDSVALAEAAQAGKDWK
jgi:predicted dehydrogenase